MTNIPMTHTVLTGLFTGCLIMAGIHGSKLVKLGPFLFDGGLLIYAMTFVITDIVAEVYGKRQAIMIAQAGFFALLAAWVMTQFAQILPASDEWEFSEAYDTILGAGSRVFLAAVISYIISQFVDIKVFGWLRDKTNGQHLWLRNNLSTVCGGGLDAIIFTTIAFYGVFPVFPIIVTAFIVRVFFSLCDTPLVYAIVWWLGKKQEFSYV